MTETNTFLTMNIHTSTLTVIIWQPRYTDIKVPSEPDHIVIEVCGDYSDTKTDFLLNELHAIIFGVGQLQRYKIPIKQSSVKVTDDLWRTVMEHGNFDPLIDGKPSSKVLDRLKKHYLGYTKIKQDTQRSEKW